MSQHHSTHPMQHASDRPTAPGDGARRIPSTDLLRGERRLIIEHGESSYTLLLTRNGKLILVK